MDELGHVNNLVWVRFIVDLGTAHSNSVGLDRSGYHELGAWWIVYRQEIDYLAPAFPGEEIEEATWISHMRGARSVRESRFARSSDGKVLVSARTTWVWVDIASQKPRRIDRRVLELFPVIPTDADAPS